MALQDPLAPVGASANPNARGYATPLVFGDLALPYKLAYEQKKLRDKAADDAAKASQDEIYKFGKDIYRDVDAAEPLRPFVNKQRDRLLNSYNEVISTRDGQNALRFLVSGFWSDANGNVRGRVPTEGERVALDRLTRVRSGIGNLIKAGENSRKIEAEERRQTLEGVDFEGDSPLQLAAKRLADREAVGQDFDVSVALADAEPRLTVWDKQAFDAKWLDIAAEQQDETGESLVSKGGDGRYLLNQTTNIKKNAENLRDQYLAEIERRVKSPTFRRKIMSSNPDWFDNRGDLVPERVKDDVPIPGIKDIAKTSISMFPSASGDQAMKNLSENVYVVENENNTSSPVRALNKPQPPLSVSTQSLISTGEDIGPASPRVEFFPEGLALVGVDSSGQTILPIATDNPRKYLEEKGAKYLTYAYHGRVLNPKLVAQSQIDRVAKMFGDGLAQQTNVTVSGGTRPQATTSLFFDALSSAGVPLEKVPRAMLRLESTQGKFRLDDPRFDAEFRALTRRTEGGSLPPPPARPSPTPGRPLPQTPPTGSSGGTGAQPIKGRQNLLLDLKPKRQ